MLEGCEHGRGFMMMRGYIKSGGRNPSAKKLMLTESVNSTLICGSCFLFLTAVSAFMKRRHFENTYTMLLYSIPLIRSLSPPSFPHANTAAPPHAKPKPPLACPAPPEKEAEDRAERGVEHHGDRVAV